MFVAVHNEKHLVGGTEMGRNFLRESGSHIPHSFLGYVSSDKSGKYIHTYIHKLWPLFTKSMVPTYSYNFHLCSQFVIFMDNV